MYQHHEYDRTKTLFGIAVVMLLSLVVGLLLVSISRKITALARSDAESRSLIESSPVPYAMNDDLGRITYLNAAFTSTFGYSIEDIPDLSQWWPKAYPDPGYRQWVGATWQRHMDDCLLYTSPSPRD